MCEENGQSLLQRYNTSFSNDNVSVTSVIMYSVKLKLTSAYTECRKYIKNIAILIILNILLNVCE